MRRWVRGVASLATLLALVVGVPLLLVVLGDNPLPQDRSLTALGRALLRPDDGSVLIGLVTVAGWLAWLVFAGSVLAELINLLRRPHHPVRLPGLGGVQRWTAGLMLAVLALLAGRASTPPPAPTPPAPAQVAPLVPGSARPGPAARVPTEVARADLTRVDLTPADLTPADPATPEPRARDLVVTVRPVATEKVPASAGAGAGPADQTHTVRVGDDLWSLAERYYGQGRDWRRIVYANRDLLADGPDRLRVGWRLVIPDAGPGASDEASRVRVRPGDTLSAIARRELGSAGRWPELFRVNRDQLRDPDQVPVGISLELPAHEAPAAFAVPSERSADGRSHHRQESSGSDAPPGSVETSRRGPAEPSPSVSPAVPRDADAGRARSDVPATGATPAVSPAVPRAGGAVSSPRTELSADPAVPLGLSAVGGLLAAGLVATLAGRRRRQLQARPVGRRIVHPRASAFPTEVQLGRRGRPISLRTLDQTMRAIAAHCTSTGTPLPALQLACVDEHELELVLAEPSPDAPVCFTVDGTRWRLTRDDARYLSSIPGLSDATRPWPGLVSLGTDAGGRQVLADLEGLGLLGLTGPVAGLSGVLNAMAVELSCAPWNEELRLTLVGEDAGWSQALSQPQVTRCDDVDALLDRLERRAQDQRTSAAEPEPGSPRLDRDRAEAWAPEIVVVRTDLAPTHRRRLVALAQPQPRTSVAAVLPGTCEGGWTLDLDAPGQARLHPPDGVSAAPARVALTLVPQTLPPPALDAVVELVAATGGAQTTPAPWWEPDPPGAPVVESVRRDPSETPADVTYLGRCFEPMKGEQEGRAEVQQSTAEHTGRNPAHPTLGLLGPLHLLGAAGPPPPRAEKQCLEYCAWLLDNPGATAQAMMAALIVAEGTRRSNMSRLRSWLGSDADGRPYLPDAYSGHIRLDPCVSSDWQQVQILTAAGVNRASSDSLTLVLELVRGAPLADAAPGQWCWAEELRTDMISCVRDVGVELAGRAVAVGDLDLARWAAARALVAAPGDELLLAMRVRTEHRAGNVSETERLSRQLAQQSRLLGADLEPATVTLLQEVLEGRIRARLA